LVTIGSGALACVMGVAVLVGWGVAVAPLRRLWPAPAASINPLTALCFVVIGGTLWGSAIAGLSARRWPILAGASVVDALVYAHALTSTGDGRPNLMAPASALSFLVLGLAIVWLEGSRHEAVREPQSLTLLALATAMLALMGHAYRNGWFTSIGTFTRMTVPTAFGIMALSLGVFATQPRRGLPGLWASDGPGGTTLRTLLPAAVLGPAVLGWAAVWGSQLGLFVEREATLLLVLLWTVGVTAIVLRHALQLERSHLERGRAERRLQTTQAELERERAKLVRANERLAGLATTDSLTALRNRRAFEERLREEVLRARRTHQPLSLLLMDIDHFKRFNDSFGHLAGDEALCEVAAILAHSLRETDLPARYGGEEFAAILPDTPRDAAAQVAERVRAAIARGAGTTRPITVSVGVAACGPGVDTARALVDAADRALYRSKAMGRNCVSLAGAA
jgi:diguanylate cyclase (GGDEF)-like protein